MSAIAGGTADDVTLYRAMSSAEAADVDDHGGFRPEATGRVSYDSVKLFFASYEHAAAFAEALRAMVILPTSFIERLEREWMDRGWC